MMGDILRTGDTRCRLAVEVAAHAPILRIDVLNGPEEIAFARVYATDQLGNRTRVTFHCPASRGRGRQTAWNVGGEHVSNPVPNSPLVSFLLLSEKNTSEIHSIISSSSYV